MTPHKSEACRKENKMLMECDMIEPSKSLWACGGVMAKTKGATIKDAYPIPRIVESLFKLGDANFFTTLDSGSAFWQVRPGKQDREKTQAFQVNWGCTSGKECRFDFAMRRLRSND